MKQCYSFEGFWVALFDASSKEKEGSVREEREIIVDFIGFCSPESLPDRLAVQLFQQDSSLR